MHPLRAFIANYTPISDADWSRIEPCLVRKEVTKNTLLLSEGTVCRHLYFLESGLLRFYILKDGTEITKYFTALSQHPATLFYGLWPVCNVLEDSYNWRH